MPLDRRSQSQVYRLDEGLARVSADKHAVLNGSSVIRKSGYQFFERSCSNKTLKRNSDSTQDHFALACQGRLKHQAREQNQSGIAVGFENGKAIVGIVNIEPHNLPGKMRGESE